MKRCVIIGGGDIKNYDIIKPYLKPKSDFYVVCDGGMEHIENLGIEPCLFVGDFDSWDKPVVCDEIIELPKEKDDTDSFFAAKECVVRGFDDFLLLGMTGGRLDHTMGNLSLLLWLHRKGKRALLADDLSEMEIVDSTPKTVPRKFSEFSLMNISGTAKGVYIENAKYPLANQTISPDYQYALSNKSMCGKNAKIWVECGELLLIKNRK